MKTAIGIISSIILVGVLALLWVPYIKDSREQRIADQENKLLSTVQECKCPQPSYANTISADAGTDGDGGPSYYDLHLEWFKSFTSKMDEDVRALKTLVKRCKKDKEDAVVYRALFELCRRREEKK